MMGLRIIEWVIFALSLPLFSKVLFLFSPPLAKGDNKDELK